MKINYREFYDVPRVFIVERFENQFLFNCPFDEDLDEYPECYKVYRLPNIPLNELPRSWVGLEKLALSYLETVDVKDVKFDPTRRKSIDSELVDRLIENLMR